MTTKSTVVWVLILARKAAAEEHCGGTATSTSRRYQKMVRAVIDAQRAEIVRLRNAGLSSNEIIHRVERELDLEDERLEI